MDFDINLDEVPELKPLPTGTYIINIESAKVGKASTGRAKVSFGTNVEQPEEIAQKIPKWYFFLMLEGESEFALSNLKSLFKALNLPMRIRTESDLQAPVGKRVGVVVTLTTDPEYGVRNQIQRFVSVAHAKPKADPVETVDKAQAEHEGVSAGAGANVSTGDIFG